MNPSNKALIDQLVDELQHGGRALGGANRTALTSMLLLIASVTLAMALLGPFRSNALAQLLSVERFFLESLLGFSAIILLAIATLRSATPGLSNTYLVAAVVAGLAWVAHMALGLALPTLPASMDGKRAHCFIEVLIYSVPSGLFLLWLAYRRYSLSPYATSLLAGIAAGLLPAWLMQFACMYDAQHGLAFHIFPALLAGAGMGMAGGWLLRRKITKPLTSLHKRT